MTPTTITVEGPPVPEGAGCPVCVSYDVGYLSANDDAGPYVWFACRACGHERTVRGRLAVELYRLLTEAPPRLDPRRN